MKVVNSISLNVIEVESMIATLKVLKEIVDNRDVATEFSDEAADAFDRLSNVLCFSPEGCQAYFNEGWSL